MSDSALKPVTVCLGIIFLNSYSKKLPPFQSLCVPDYGSDDSSCLGIKFLFYTVSYTVISQILSVTDILIDKSAFFPQQRSSIGPAHKKSKENGRKVLRVFLTGRAGISVNNTCSSIVCLGTNAHWHICKMIFSNGTGSVCCVKVEVKNKNVNLIRLSRLQLTVKWTKSRDFDMIAD